MADYYPRFIADWMDGTKKLSDRSYRLYDVIINLIMHREGPIEYHAPELAGMCNCATQAIGYAVKELVAARKIEIIDGKIHNRRAVEELEKLSTRRKGKAKRNVPEPQTQIEHGPNLDGTSMEPRWNPEQSGAVLADEINEINGLEEYRNKDSKVNKKEKNIQKTEPASPLDASPKKLKKASAKKTADESFRKILAGALCPESVSRVMEIRKAKRLISTDEGARDLIENFAKFGDAEAAVRVMARQGWGGFRKSWTERMTADELGIARPASPTETTDWRPILEMFCKSQTWQWGRLSPEPGSPGCKIPAEIIAEYAERMPASPLAGMGPARRLSLVPSQSERAA